jgi:2-polyprenyl-3-methyl-5-hydroxy-6-metoxy-1,4-benzoquinol methylase
VASCPFCKAESGAFYKVKDYNRKSSKEDFFYFRCPTCKLIFISRVPDDLNKYYAQEYYRIPSLHKLKRIAKVERYKMDLLKDYVKPGALLEIGPAFGVFAYQAKQAGFQVDAIEMDERCCQYLKKVVGVNAVNSDMPQKAVESMKKHDLIAMWHVLEHLVDSWGCLGAVAKNLNPAGILVIATPNPQAFQFRVMGAYWPHLDAPRHLNLIPLKVLVQYLKPFGLELIMLTTNDKGGKGWNRFGWQRYLMNRFSNKWLQRFAFVLGYFVALLMSFLDCRRGRGSAYTVIFQKAVGVI